MIKFSPSILSADFIDLGRDIRAVEQAGADYLHFDVMDGHFVPNISFGLPVLKAVRKNTALPLDVHLMISEPDRYIDRFAAAGADLITVHAESEGDTRAQLRHIRELGLRASVSIRPSTPLETILPLLPELDMVLIMTVEPGFGGQSFLLSTVPKIRELRRIVDREGWPCDIEIDGGVTEDNVKTIAGYGANVIVAGSAVFAAPDPGKALQELRRKTEE